MNDILKKRFIENDPDTLIWAYEPISDDESTLAQKILESN
jgi:hypothetical protein